MPATCEVCNHLRPRSVSQFPDKYRVIEVKYDARSVHLCVGHARIAANSGVVTFEDLRELYGTGRRSFVPRRDPAVPHGNGEPRSCGRRFTDAASAE